MIATKSNSDDICTVEAIVSVSRETKERLEQYVGLLRKWQTADNLVSSGTLPVIWRRHVADSAQLVRLFPEIRIWLDLGSGAGFPGLVTAILLAGSAGTHVHLVESNRRKCSFLRQAIRETGAPAEVHEGRIETLLAAWAEPVEMISARALASLNVLFSLTEPIFRSGAAGAFHKGRDYEREIEEASKSWSFDLVIHKSLVEEGGVILEIRGLARKASSSFDGVRGRP